MHAGDDAAGDAEAGRLGGRGRRAVRPQPARVGGGGGQPRRSTSVRELTDRQGTRLVDALAENGVALERMLDAHAELKTIDARAYLELHIEQGPVLESMQKPTGVVLGTFGVERHMLRFIGQAAHSGIDADSDAARRVSRRRADRARMPRDRDCATRSPAARRQRRLHRRRRQRRAEDRDGGARRLRDLARSARARGRRARARCCATRARRPDRAARENNVTVEWRELWRIEPRPFDPTLVRLCEEAVREETGDATAPAVRPAARRGRNGAAHAGRDDVRVFVERPVALQGRGHAGAAPRNDDPRVPAAGRENHRPRRRGVTSQKLPWVGEVPTPTLRVTVPSQHAPRGVRQVSDPLNSGATSCSRRDACRCTSSSSSGRRGSSSSCRSRCRPYR